MDSDLLVLELSSRRADINEADTPDSEEDYTYYSQDLGRPDSRDTELEDDDRHRVGQHEGHLPAVRAEIEVLREERLVIEQRVMETRQALYRKMAPKSKPKGQLGGCCCQMVCKAEAAAAGVRYGYNSNGLWTKACTKLLANALYSEFLKMQNLWTQSTEGVLVTVKFATCICKDDAFLTCGMPHVMATILKQLMLLPWAALNDCKSTISATSFDVFQDVSLRRTIKNQQNKRQNTGQAYTAGNSDRKPYAGPEDVRSACNRTTKKTCNIKHNKQNNNNNNNNRAMGCFECGDQGHFKRNCPRLRNNDRGNQAGNDRAPTKVYVFWKCGGKPRQRRCGSQIDITPSTLDHYYDVELADGRIIGLNTILKGCTLNFLNHQFNINLMPVELGSFDAIIGMDWLAKYQAVIVCAEKVVHIPWRNKTLIIHGDGSNQGNVTRLNIISCTKAQKYMEKGFPIFLAHITAKEVEDKSEKKRLEVKFEWGDKQEAAALNCLKQKLCSAPILNYPRKRRVPSLMRRFKKGFGRCVDAERKCFLCFTQLSSLYGVHRSQEFATHFRSKRVEHEATPMERTRTTVMCSRALVMTISLDLPKQILNAQTEARKPENINSEDVGGMLVETLISRGKLETKSWNHVRLEHLYLNGRKGAGIPCYGDLRTCNHAESNKAIFIHTGLQTNLYRHEEAIVNIKGHQDCWYNLKYRQMEWGHHLHGFCSSFPKTSQGYDTIWVIVDRLTKSAIFTPMRETDPLDKLARMYLKEVVTRHGIPVSIICDRDPRFASNFWRSLQNALGTNLDQESKVLRARDRQKSYADLKRKPMEFQVGDKVMLKVSPWKGVVRFSKRGKLNSRYVGPFKVIERVGEVAYKLELPKELSRVHNTFHVSNLKRRNRVDICSREVKRSEAKSDSFSQSSDGNPRGS
ncbi:putative reverse transcriptase domain-containing protein [Tanacetum coccineum]